MHLRKLIESAPYMDVRVSPEKGCVSFNQNSLTRFSMEKTLTRAQSGLIRAFPGDLVGYPSVHLILPMRPFTSSLLSMIITQIDKIRLSLNEHLMHWQGIHYYS